MMDVLAISIALPVMSGGQRMLDGRNPACRLYIL
jgi:hypothetical protein